jgi:hypothetical protein
MSTRRGQQMAFFNPNRVDFNYNTNMIDAVGAVGRSLWDIYKENVAKNQNQMKINETMRSNLASEALTGAKNDETVRHDLATEAETASNNAFTQKFKQSELGAKINNWNNQAAHYANQDRIGAMNANTMAYNADTSRMNANTSAGRLDFDKNKQYAKSQEDALYVDAAFGMLGGDMPQNLTPEQQARYKKAFVQARSNPQIAKIVGTQDGGVVKNLPVGIQNRLNNAKALMDRYTPYANDLVANESQISGALDNLTAPIGRWAGLNSDVVAGLYADAEAIADMERAYTKGGGNQAKISAYNQIRPVNTLFSTTLAGVAARIDNQLSAYDEAIKTLQSQGNYSGVNELISQRDEMILGLPKEILPFLKTGRQGQKSISIEDKFKQKAKLAQQDYYEQADEHGGYYAGSPLDEEW